MKTFKALALAGGLTTFAYLLWRLDASSVWAYIAGSGPGMALILFLPVFDHWLNAYGWKFAFTAEEARRLSLGKLFKARVVGDGINYLTPSATIAGEIVRPTMLDEGLTPQAKIASVLVARFTQSLGQAFFIMSSLLLAALTCPPGLENMPLILAIRKYLAVPATFFSLALLGIAIYALLALKKQRESSLPPPASETSDYRKVKRQIGSYFLSHPGRFTISTLLFTGGYFLGTFETWLTGRFMGIGITPYLALTIEAAASAFEGLVFMVPAKIGTQEAGKTAVFKGLGLAPAQGLAMGLIRHCREIIWAGFGLLVYARERKKGV